MAYLRVAAQSAARKMPRTPGVVDKYFTTKKDIIWKWKKKMTGGHTLREKG